MGDGRDDPSPRTEAPVQPNEQLADAEGDGGVGRDDDGFIPTSGIPAVIDLKLKQDRNLSGPSDFTPVSPRRPTMFLPRTLMVVPLIPAWTVREHWRVVRMLSTTTHRTLRPLSLDWRTRH